MDWLNCHFCGYYVKKKKKKSPVPLASTVPFKIWSWAPGAVEGELETVCILISCGGDIQSAHPELRSGSDECVAEISHADNK